MLAALLPLTSHPQILKIPISFFRVSESNEIMFEGRRIDIRSVRANVERLHAEKPEAKVVINSHPKAKTEIYVMISDQSREAGVYDISLSTTD